MEEPKEKRFKKRIIIAVLKGYVIGAVTGAIFVSELRSLSSSPFSSTVVVLVARGSL